MAASFDDLFGARFVAARRAAGLSQEAVVERIERDGIRLHVTAIGKIERGERRVTVGEGLALAGSLGLTIEDLLGINGPLEGARALLHDARGELLRASGAYYRALSEYARAVEDQYLDLSDDERYRLSREPEGLTPARLIALYGMKRLSSDLALREVDTDYGFGADLVNIDNVDRMAVIEAAGGIEAVSEIVNRDG